MPMLWLKMYKLPIKKIYLFTRRLDCCMLYRLTFLSTRLVLKMAAVDFATFIDSIKRKGLMRISSHDDKVESSPKRKKKAISS